MKKAIIITLVTVVLLGGLVAALVWRPVETTNHTANRANDTPSTPAGPADAPGTSQAEGRYVAYEANEVSKEGYNDTILFFHASWCPECRAFETAINESEIPKGVQILKVDYDSSADLRQRYGVTIQSTFVKVNEFGERESSWVGYGKDKSVDAILENT